VGGIEGFLGVLRGVEGYFATTWGSLVTTRGSGCFGKGGKAYLEKGTTVAKRAWFYIIR